MRIFILLVQPHDNAGAHEWSRKPQARKDVAQKNSPQNNKKLSLFQRTLTIFFDKYQVFLLQIKESEVILYS